MKKLFFTNALIIIILVLSITSCKKNSDNTQDKWENTKITQVASWTITDPIILEKNAPKVEESISKVSEKLKEEPSYRACIARSTQMCWSEVISKFIIEKDSDKDCDIFEDYSLKTSCIKAINTELARKKIDSTYCAKLDETSKVICEQQVILAQAIKEKDANICEKLKKTEPIDSTISWAILVNSMVDQDYNSQCILQVIMTMNLTKKDLKICESIKNDVVKQDCISQIKSNIEMQKNTLKVK